MQWTPRCAASPAWSDRTRSAAMSCGRSNSSGSPAARPSTSRCRGSPACCETWAKPEPCTPAQAGAQTSKRKSGPLPPQGYSQFMSSPLDIDRSISGQPWRWRRPPDDSLGMDALVDELLLARGVERGDLARHRDSRIRDFLPDPSCFQDMDKGAKRLADAVQQGETTAIFGDYDV